MIPPCSFEWGRKLPQHVEAQRWIQKRMISPVSSQMRDTSFFWIICPALWWFNELTVFFCWCSLQPSLNNKPMMFVSSFAPSSKLTFSPKFLGRWSSRKCYSHRFLRLAPTPVPDLVGNPWSHVPTCLMALCCTFAHVAKKWQVPLLSFGWRGWHCLSPYWIWPSWCIFQSPGAISCPKT